jgi:hypothetical protein
MPQLAFYGMNPIIQALILSITANVIALSLLRLNWDGCAVLSKSSFKHNHGEPEHAQDPTPYW